MQTHQRRLVSIFLFGLLAIQGIAQPKKITILHTNDMHASFLPHEAGWIQSDPKPIIGGFRELSWMVDSIRHALGSVLVLDAGDVMTGSPISEFDYKGSTGGALYEMMNMIGYDAWTIGNHDLDISQENLRQHTRIVHFPTVSANLTDSLGAFPFNNKEYVIIQKEGLRIGIVGLMSRELFTLTNTNNLKGLKVLPPVEVAQRIIDAIQPQTDLMVALTHEGVDEDSILAASTHGLNVIIGGHSHTRLKVPKVVNGVLICQSGSNCENLGELELTVDNKKVTQYNGKLMGLWARDRKANAISQFIDEYKEKIDKEYGEIVGTLKTDWKRDKVESNIGEYVVEAMRGAANAQWGVTNNSGLRKDLRAGPIKKADLFEILPFRNVLCTFSIGGKDLRAFVLRYVQSLNDGKPTIQLAGLSASWKRENGSVVIDSLRAGGQEVVDEHQYVGATLDFVINQADKYLGFVPKDVSYSAMTMFRVIVEKVRNDKIINNVVEHHFREIQ